MPSVLMSDLVEEFIASQDSNGFSENTRANKALIARRFLTHTGNIYAHNVGPRHIDAYFTDRQAEGLAPSTLNNNLNVIRLLFEFAAQRRYLKAGTPNPCAHRRPFRVMRKNRLRIPAAEFERLLDCAQHPADRAVVALGLYLFLRRSEIRLLTVGDLHLQSSTVDVTIPKSAKADEMPVCEELDREMRRWLTWYSSRIGRNLRDDDYLVPAKSRPRLRPGNGWRTYVADVEAATLNPTRPISRPEAAVNRTLKAFGIEIRDSSGKAAGEGVHTLRRSGARALFDAKVGDGYDGALRLVQAMLHHSQSSTTEVYLGIDLDRKKRDTAIKGQRMFPKNGENVVRIGVQDEEGHVQGGVRRVRA